MNNKTIKGNLDNLGYIYINSSIINVERNIRIDGVKTIIDTGAYSSFIQKELINQLQLKPYRESTYRHPMNGEILTSTYKASLIINSTQLNNFIVNEFQTADYPCGILIGMNIIKYCELNYSGKNKTFELTIPEEFV